MFYVIKNEQLYTSDTRNIAYYGEVKELKNFSLEEYLKNQDKFVIDNGNILDISQTKEYKVHQLEKAKVAKQSENLKKAYEAEQNGLISFKSALIETTTANISKLTSQFAMLQAGIIESVQWLSKDDLQLELSATELIALGQAIAEYTGAVWNVHYLRYKEQIEAAQTVAEVEEVLVEYARE